MLLNYFKIAWRNLLRHKLFSAINVLGLAIGLACSMVIALYVFNQLSFDCFHGANIYRINKTTNENGRQAQNDALTPGLLAPELIKSLPEVKYAARFRPWFNDLLISHDSTSLKLKEVSFADASFLQIFNFPTVQGDAATALSEPSSAVLTETTARNLFGDENPMGKTLYTLNNIPVKVNGIVKDIPQNSSIQFSMLISWSTLTSKPYAGQFGWMNNWTAQVGFTFLQFRSEIDPKAENRKISSLLHLHFQEDEFSYQTWLQSASDLHLHSKDILYAENFRTASNSIVYILMVIAAFILLIACFNFINLSTVAAIGRLKEAGIQKVLGAHRIQLIGKFLLESFLLCTIALGFACLIINLMLPVFNKFAESQLSIESLFRPAMFASMVVLWIGMGLLAGLYPALILSRVRSTEYFRGGGSGGTRSWFKKGLVTAQFALSMFLVVATLAVQHQMEYLTHRNLGFDREQLVAIPISGTQMESDPLAFIQELRTSPSVLSVTASDNIPGKGFNGYGIIADGIPAREKPMANVIETDAAFAGTYGIALKQGRYFSPDMPTDTGNSIVINEAMAKYLNWQNPVGKTLELYEAQKGKVIGVVQDFNFTSLREAIHPLAILLRNHPQWVTVKLRSGEVQSALSSLGKAWKKLDRKYPFEFHFVEEEMNKFYKTDLKLLQVLGVFAMLAIFVAAMGLLGLSLQTVRARSREISIRKVLGASGLGIMTLLSKDFLRPVALGALLAFPAAAWAIHAWLQDFAYRSAPGWEIYMLGGLLLVLVALLTVGLQSIRAVHSNPATSLRNE